MSKVAGKVTKVESKGLYIKLENGKDAFLPKENMFIGKKKKLEEIFSVGFVIKAEEKNTKDSLVILTQKELKQAEGEKKKVEKNSKEKQNKKKNNAIESTPPDRPSAILSVFCHKILMSI